MSSLAQKFSSSFIITGEVSSAFQKALTRAAKDTNYLKTQTVGLGRSLAQVDRLTQGLVGLKEQRAKYLQLQGTVRSLTAQISSSTGSTEKLQMSLNRATTAAGRAKNAINDQVTALKKVRTSLQAAGVDTNALALEQTRLKAAVATSTSEMLLVDKVKVAVGRVATAYASLRRDISSVTVAALGLGAASYGIYRLAKYSTDFGESASVTGKAIGMTAKELEQARYAASKFAIGSDQADAAIRRMLTSTAVARDGLSLQGRAFQRLGLSANTLSYQSATGQMEQFARAFHDLKNPNDRATIGAQIFGKEDGAKFAEFLAQGPKALRASQQEALAIGVALSDEENERLEAAALKISVFQQRMNGLRTSVGMTLTPVVIDALDRIGRFVQVHQSEIMRFVRILSDGIHDALPSFGRLARAALAVGDALAKLISITPHWVKATLIAAVIMGTAYRTAAKLTWGLGKLAWYIGSPLIRGCLYLATVFKVILVSAIERLSAALVGLDIAFPPLLLLSLAAAALAGIALLVYKYWKPLAAFFKGIFGGAADSFKGFFSQFEPLRPLANKIAEAISSVSRAFASVTAQVDPGINALNRYEAAGRRLGHMVRYLVDPRMSLAALGARKVGLGFLFGGSGSDSPVSYGGAGGSWGSSASGPAAVPQKATGGSVTYNVTNHIHPHPGQSPEAIAANVIRLLKQADHLAARSGMRGNFAYS